MRTTNTRSTTLTGSPRGARHGATVRWGAAVLLLGLIPFLPMRSITAAPLTELPKLPKLAIQSPLAVEPEAARPRMTGLVDVVLVKRGAIVEAGQILARLDATEMDHQIETLTYKIAIVNEDLDAGLRAAARGITNRLEDRRQTLLRKSALEADVRYFKALRRKLDIRAPIAGRIANRDPQALVGRRAEAGEALLVIEPSVGEAYF